MGRNGSIKALLLGLGLAITVCIGGRLAHLGYWPFASAAKIEAQRQRLTDESSQVRIEAIIALGKMGPAATEALEEAMNDENADIRGFAVRRLGRIGTEGQPALERAREDDDRKVRQSVDAALGQIQPPTVFHGVVNWVGRVFP